MAERIDLEKTAQEIKAKLNARGVPATTEDVRRSMRMFVASLAEFIEAGRGSAYLRNVATQKTKGQRR